MFEKRFLLYRNRSVPIRFIHIVSLHMVHRFSTQVFHLFVRVTNFWSIYYINITF